MKNLRIACLLLLLLSGAVRCLSGRDKSGSGRKSVTVADTISMTQLGISDEMLSGDDRFLQDAGLVAHFSPDGKKFFVVLKQGDTEHNTIRFSIHLFETAQAFHAPRSEPILTMESSSNQEAIKKPKWLDDNKTVSFIGQNNDELPQVYTFNTATQRLRKLTSHPTPVVDYDMKENGETLLFMAEPLPGDCTSEAAEARKKGIVITSQGLGDLLAGDCIRQKRPYTSRVQLFASTKGRTPVHFPIEDQLMNGVPLSLSPDGRYAITAALVRNIPAMWAEYENDLLRPFVVAKKKAGEASRIVQYLLLNVENRTAEPLLSVPWSYQNDAFAWAPDGHSVIVSGAYLPLRDADPVEIQARKKKKYVVEVGLPTREFQKITDKDLSVLGWSRASHKLLLRARGWWKQNPLTAFEKDESAWKEAAVAPEDSLVPLNISYEEDLNSPPKLFASDQITYQKSLLLDLNPQFSEFAFGREEAVTWKATDGHEVSGGLYLPPSYEPGKRYPLVIQTHGFLPEKFWIDGPWNSAFAAQPLASRGFVVLQVGHAVDVMEDQKYINTPQEADRQMAAFEGAIDFLQKKDLIDTEKVGIIGFSRTVYHVAYTLTHSKYHFAAATLADGIDGGYFQYRAFPDSADSDLVNGGRPVEKNLASWLDHSPGFNLDKVKAAVRLEAYGAVTILEGWEWFQGLSQLGKPTDFIYLPDAQHTLVKPWERLVSQQGNVDWFCFWLKGEEDAEPAKAEQYKRWRELSRSRPRVNAAAAAN